MIICMSMTKTNKSLCHNQPLYKAKQNKNNRQMNKNSLFKQKAS